MRLIVAAVGRMKAGPERELLARYVERAQPLARTLGFGGVDLREIEESRARAADDRKRDEAGALMRELPPGARLIVLDERGQSMPSVPFADRMAAIRDGGAVAIALVIGGPDGLAASLRAGADLCIAYGAATFPHQLVRVLAAEQIYRALTILSGHPYHRV